MAALTLKALLSPRSGSLPAVEALRDAMGASIAIVDLTGKPLLGQASEDQPRIAIVLDEAILGFVVGPEPSASAMASLLSHLAARESGGRALASEVLHLYREVNLIEQLSEQLAALLNSAAVGQAALAQAQRLITATHGSVVLADKDTGLLQSTAAFAPEAEAPSVNVEQAEAALGPASRFIASVLDRGIGEIVNACNSDPRALASEQSLHALICAPLRSGQRTVGVIALASNARGVSYAAADLKLLNTIALQTAAAMENSLLCAEMVDAARERTAFAAELQAASTVQQMLLQSASSFTPGFQVNSIYLPASEVGGDFFFVSPAPDGSLTAIVGDVSGKGLTAAMRVAMILGALRRETSHDPPTILAGLNDALLTQGQLGFTTACCVRIALSGEFSLANAGHIAPYISGREVETPPALPLGLVPDQTYELVKGALANGEQLILLSDGVPEARSESGELYGFDRLSSLTLLPAQQIADIAKLFGQEDDITVLELSLLPS